MVEIGSYIGDRYEIIEKIGAGGMSDVFKAKDQVLGRFVAIKVLKQEFAEDVNFVAKFHAEAQSAALLQHPNIVNIYDVGSEGHVHFIVMEYVEGITLKTYIEKKSMLNYKEAISIAIQVGRGIEAAHNNKIVHRDIKPQNIMISNEGKVKVMDFGIARAATSNTIHSDVMGSVHYSSPEQARNGFVDCKSDIYSLGIVMYEMVTGRVPFDGDTTVAIAIQHLQEEIIPPSNFASDLPISLEKIILKCTQKSQDRRYPTMGDLLNDLKHALMKPDEDFVVIETAVSAGKTTVIGQEELEDIRRVAASRASEPIDVYDEFGMERGGGPVRDNNSGIDENWADTSVRSRDKNIADEEESDGFLNPKMEKLVTILGIVVAGIIICVIIGILLNMFVCSGDRPGKDDDNNTRIEIGADGDDDDTEKIENNTGDNDSSGPVDTVDKIAMIDIKNMTESEAKTALESIGLVLFSDGTISSDIYDEGKVCSQSVEPGVEVNIGSTINVKISSGKGEIDIPDVVGKTDEAAINMLEDAKLKYKREYEFSNDVAKDVVIRQDPGVGSKAAVGDVITIYVSEGIEQIPMISVIGLTEEKAGVALEQAKFDLGIVTTEYSSTVKRGKIISQSIQEGTMTPSGTAVDVVISLGTEEKLYKFAAEITLPNDDSVSGAEIVLYDSEGFIEKNWTANASEFPLTITADEIETETGKLVINWIMRDENGEQSIHTQESSFTFKPM